MRVGEDLGRCEPRARSKARWNSATAVFPTPVGTAIQVGQPRSSTSRRRRACHAKGRWPCTRSKASGNPSVRALSERSPPRDRQAETETERPSSAEDCWITDPFRELDRCMKRRPFGEGLWSSPARPSRRATARRTESPTLHVYGRRQERGRDPNACSRTWRLDLNQPSCRRSIQCRPT
jgi:hypothetical protein